MGKHEDRADELAGDLAARGAGARSEVQWEDDSDVRLRGTRTDPDIQAHVGNPPARVDGATLGPRADRLPSAAHGFGLREYGGEVTPLTEAFEVAFATRESEARDRAAAMVELVEVFEWILSSARDAMVRQGNKAIVESVLADGGDASLTLRYRAAPGATARRSFDVRVRTSKKDDLVVIEGGSGYPAAFRFERRRWFKAARDARGAIVCDTSAGPSDPAQYLVNILLGPRAR